MTDLDFHPAVVLRAPVYSYNFYSTDNLAHVLKQPFFQKAIYFSSEIFYNELQKKGFDLDTLDKKAIETLKKYFNRMCFRPTPFGPCSAIGALQWGNATAISFDNHNLQTHIQFSYSKSAEYAQKLLGVSRQPFFYKLNPSLYKTGSEYRFLRSNQDNSQIEFIIDSLKTDRFFERLLKYITHYHTKNQLLNYVCQQVGCTADEANAYVQWLIESQVITHSLEANITGEDYAERLLNNDTENLDPTYISICQQVAQNRQTITPADLGAIPQPTGDGMEPLKSADYYVNLQVKLPASTLDTTYQQDIKDALHCLDKLCTTQQPAGLADFTKAFSRKFDAQTIPLLMALDPEVGISYGNLAVEEDNVNIVKDIFDAANAEKSTPIAWSKAHSMLLKKWNSLSRQNQPIVLTDEDLNEIENEKANYPPTMSVLFRVLGGKVFIESAGGNCASSLIGRFTPFSDDIHNLATDMAATEARHNPDVIFAEIAHICHNHTANIDRRAHIYPYEIPVLVHSTIAADKQIQLSDLWVSIIGGEVILQSKKYGKRVVPRLSSAFNYSRNDLAVFRFLCDLQKAGIKTNFSLNLGNFFPGLTHYPRVEYKNTILQLAFWNLKKDAFLAILNAGADEKLASFKALKQQLGLPGLVALTQNDHQLVFNLDKDDEVFFFLETLKTQKQITVKEYLLPGGEHPVVTGDDGQHVNQMIASLYHRQTVYKPVTRPIPSAKTSHRKIIPGGEWLYLKMFCHPVRSNELLAGCVRGILKKLNTNKLISEWFFIRYLESGYHIRLRLKVNPQKHQEVLNTVHANMKPYINDGIVSNYTIDTYERELERYSPVFITDFERSFFGSSNLVLAFLERTAEQLTGAGILQFAVVSVNDIAVTLGLTGKKLTGFLERVFNSFEVEFSAINELRYQLDIEFRKQKQVIELARKDEDIYYKNLKLDKQRALFIQTLTHLKNTVTGAAEWQEKWVGDIIHMHLNRLFINDSRKQEMAVYYFLLKHERSAQARQTKGQFV